MDQITNKVIVLEPDGCTRLAATLSQKYLRTRLSDRARLPLVCIRLQFGVMKPERRGFVRVSGIVNPALSSAIIRIGFAFGENNGPGINIDLLLPLSKK